MSRLFTFGCSFTNYHWPTWADIVARQHSQFQNWGRSGAGNLFIFNSLVEAHKRNSFVPGDTVMVMWSSLAREDRYVRNNWLLSGSIYGQNVYDKEWVEQFADPNGYLIRDLALISAARTMLTALGVTWYFMSTVPFECYEDWAERWFSPQRRILRLYQDDIAVVRPSVYDVVFQRNWRSRPGYVNYQDLETRYNQCRGPDWPKSWQQFLAVFQHGQGTVSDKIQQEVLEQFEFGSDLVRTDYHPTPSEHLEYLDRVLPEIAIGNKDREWVDSVDCTVKEKGAVSWTPRPAVVRF